VNYYFTGALIILLMLFVLFVKPAHSGSTQTNVSGSNTAIEGGYTSESTTTYETGSESTSTTNNTTNSDIRSAPPSAAAPSYNAMTQDVCAVGISAGIQTFGIGVSGGKHVTDKNCERLKLARKLNDFGMKVAAVAILCQDHRVFEAMNSAGTPCPFQGKIGKDAASMWEKYPELRPDYENHVERTKIIENIDAEILAQQLKEAEEEAERIAAEEAKKAEEEALKKAEEEVKLNEETIIIIDSVPVAIHGE